MTNEDFQNLVLEKLVKIESTMATKEDIARLDDKIEQFGQVQQNDVYGLLKAINEKTDRFEAKVDILAHRLLEQEVDIQILKRAK